MPGKNNILKKIFAFMKQTSIMKKSQTDHAIILWETEKNRYLVYKEPLDEVVKERSLMKSYLGEALNKKEFELFYQPQILLDSGKISGFEALIRWNSPELGFIPPDRFIGIAEETRLIISIGEWVLKTACSFIKNLHNKGCTGLTIAVNVSIIQLLEEGFTKTVLDALEESDLSPDCLELEITETIMIESYDRIGQKLESLRSMGIKIALDDFGRGYSSLSGLCHLPINTLKIDKLFMDSILEEGPKKSIIDLIIQIGRKMGLMVLAEGIETKAQVEYLMQYQCLKAQGYYFSKPLTKTSAESLVEKMWEEKAV